jgi:hypothetical protein
VKKLLIHIGYPKTATTTIEDSLFAKLHEAKRINYLGIADYSSNNYFRQAHYLMDSLSFNETFKVDELKISSNKINIISHDDFTAPKYVRDCDKRRKVVDPFEYPQRLFSLFKNAVDSIEIMVTIRNQKDLLFSYYVQKYYLFVNDKHNDTVTKFIFENGKILRKERFKNFYFSDLLGKYEESFGKKNMHILLFEDLKNDPKFFCDQLSQIINVESSLVETLLTGKHLREKKKTETGYYTEVPKRKALGKVLKELQKNALVDKIINSYKERYGSNSKILNAIRKLMYKEDSIFIPKLSEEEQNIIFNEFRESNLKLSEEYNIDQEKLKKYGYI